MWHTSCKLEPPPDRWHHCVQNKWGDARRRGQSHLRYQPVRLWYHYTAEQDQGGTTHTTTSPEISNHSPSIPTLTRAHTRTHARTHTSRTFPSQHTGPSSARNLHLGFTNWWRILCVVSELDTRPRIRNNRLKSTRRPRFRHGKVAEESSLGVGCVFVSKHLTDWRQTSSLQEIHSFPQLIVNFATQTSYYRSHKHPLLMYYLQFKAHFNGRIPNIEQFDRMENIHDTYGSLRSAIKWTKTRLKIGTWEKLIKEGAATAQAHCANFEISLSCCNRNVSFVIFVFIKDLLYEILVQ